MGGLRHCFYPNKDLTSSASTISQETPQETSGYILPGLVVKIQCCRIMVCDHYLTLLLKIYIYIHICTHTYLYIYIYICRDVMGISWNIHWISWNMDGIFHGSTPWSSLRCKTTPPEKGKHQAPNSSEEIGAKKNEFPHGGKRWFWKNRVRQ